MMISYILLGGLSVAMIMVGYFSSKVSQLYKTQHFLIANRSVGAFLVAAGLIMGWVDAATFGFVGGLALNGGIIAVLVLILAEVVPFYILGLFAEKIRARGAHKGMIMMSDIIKDSFSARSTIVSGIATFMYFFLWMLVQFVVGTNIINSIFGVPQVVSALVMGGITFLYLFFGGFRAQIYTDFVQFILLGGFILVVLGFFIPPIHEWGLSVIDYVPADSHSLFALFIVFVGSTLAAPDVWQRIYSAKSEDAAKKSMWWSMLFASLIDLFFASIGFIIKHYHLATSADDIAQAVFKYLIPGWFLPLALLVFFALVLSTVATTLFGASLALINDIFLAFNTDGNKERIPTLQRASMLFLVVLAVLLNFSKLSLVSIVFYSFIACLIPLPFVFAAILDIKVKDISVFIAMAFGLASYFGGMYFGYLDSLGALWPLCIELAVFVLCEAIISWRRKVQV